LSSLHRKLAQVLYRYSNRYSNRLLNRHGDNFFALNWITMLHNGAHWTKLAAGRPGLYPPVMFNIVDTGQKNNQKPFTDPAKRRVRTIEMAQTI
jgi:hypothetical protein